MFHSGVYYDTIRAKMMNQLTKRQLQTLHFIEGREVTTNRDLKDFLKDASRVTIVRDVNTLLGQRLITKQGKGRSVYYQVFSKNSALKYIDPDIYFEKGPDEREVFFEHFNFDVFNIFENIFQSEELAELNNLNLDYRKRIAVLPEAIVKKEFERLTVEFSWKSSRIEGNTYSLLETEILIKEHKEAEGHKKEEATMILNHKEALDYILASKEIFRDLTLAKIDNLHQIIVKNLGVPIGLRKNAVGITGTKYQPLDNEHQIREAMERFVGKTNQINSPFFKAVFVILMISYIQPFVDGNKRTARILGNAVLLAYGLCPLSLRSIDGGDYRKSVILFYEQNSIRFVKDLFIEQFKFSVENYFR